MNFESCSPLSLSLLFLFFFFFFFFLVSLSFSLFLALSFSLSELTKKIINERKQLLLKIPLREMLGDRRAVRLGFSEEDGKVGVGLETEMGSDAENGLDVQNCV